MIEQVKECDAYEKVSYTIKSIAEMLNELSDWPKMIILDEN